MHLIPCHGSYCTPPSLKAGLSVGEILQYFFAVVVELVDSPVNISCTQAILVHGDMPEHLCCHDVLRAYSKQVSAWGTGIDVSAGFWIALIYLNDHRRLFDSGLTCIAHPNDCNSGCSKSHSGLEVDENIPYKN